MKFEILTLFPEMFSPLRQGILGRAILSEIFYINFTNIRDYSKDRHKKCDDTPFGGGAGMVMTPQPIHDAIVARDAKHEMRRILMSPKGARFTHNKAFELASGDDIMLVCGSYEGIDERIIERDIDELISIGDYVLTGGELAAMVVVNAVARHINGVLGNEQSAHFESFSDGLLEYPQYTRPAIWNGMSVPEVLLSGNHAEIAKWRREKQLADTKTLRPDILKNEDS